jgi:hypothetical protein
MMAGMSAPALSTVHFAHLARTLVAVARQQGYAAPSFRSPPRLVGVDRSLRRHRSGAVVVKLRDRPWAAVAGDMIEGVVAANGLVAPHADRLRSALWQALGEQAPLERVA